MKKEAETADKWMQEELGSFMDLIREIAPVGGEIKECSKCDGLGHMSLTFELANDEQHAFLLKCPYCGGTGKTTGE